MRCFAFVLLCTFTATAQVPNSAGPFAGTGIGLSVGPGSSLNPEDLWIKKTGFTPPTPAIWATPAFALPRPDFRMSAILHAARPGCGVPTGSIDIDAISVGLDFIWSNDDGEVVPPPANGAWNVLLFSVGPTAGAPGSVVAQERDRTDSKAGVEGDVFTYVMPGSSRLPAALQGITQRAVDRTEMGLGAGDAIDALDSLMRVYQLDDLAYAKLIARFPDAATPTLYFSVSTGTTANVPTSWWNRPMGGGSTTPSGATILQSMWIPGSGSGSGGWSCPRVFRSYSDLDIDVGEDITALAVDEANERMLYSEAPYAGRQDPIMFFNFAAGSTTPPAIYRYPTDTETSVSSTMGMTKTDFVSALCGEDPRFFPEQGGITASFTYSVGTPIDPAACVPVNGLSASAFRDVDSAGNPHLRSFLIGWPDSTPQPGFALARMSIIDPAAASCFLWDAASTVLPVFVRNPANMVCGDPIELDIALPTSLVVPPNALVLQWISLSLSTVYPASVGEIPIRSLVIDRTYPLVLPLPAL